MNPKMVIKTCMWLIFIFQFTVFIHSQSDLRQDSSFFLSKQEQIEHWLQKNSIDQIYKFDNFEIYKTKLVVNLSSRFSSSDSTFAMLNKINRMLDSVEPSALEKRLFNMLAFELEIGKDSLELNLGSNLKGKRIIVSYDKNKGIEVNINKMLRSVRDFKPIFIEIDELALPASPSISIDKPLTLKDIRKSISDFFRDYFRNKGTYFYDAQMDVLKESSSELTIEVSKLSKEILTDRNYFEYIRIEVKLQKTDKGIEIKYQIQGKYSGGFGFAPRRSEYRNMEPDFAEYLENYEDKIERKIIQLLTK